MSEQLKTCGQCNVELPADSLSALCSQCLLQIGLDTQPQQPQNQSAPSAPPPTFVAPTVAELAPHFPQLEIKEVLGHGGMGVVYLARQIELDRLVALKILRPNISHDAGFAERFLREARALAKLNHPNIITVYDFGRKDALFFFIMEFVDGANLRHVERVGQLSPAEALNIVPQICSALQYAHDNGVVHRDIKPENILITKSGDVRIADFGLAKLAGNKDDAILTGTWQVMGTPHYMAPEQIEQPTTVDHRADIYSLGVVIYELLTGELPIGRFRLPSEKVQVDVRLDEVVLRSLDKEPDRRYQRVTDVATAVEEASAERTPAGAAIRTAAAWSAKQAQLASDGAKKLQNQATKLAANRQNLGTQLMWISLIDILINVWFLASPPQTEPVALTCLASIMAASITFWLGRQYRLHCVSRPMWLLAIFSVPWFSPFFLFSLLRAGITVVMLLEKMRTTNAAPDSTPSSTEENLAVGTFEPDFFERCIAATQRFLKKLTLRRVFFTAFGIFGWSGLCIGAFALVFNVWYFYSVESQYEYRDTANGICSEAGKFQDITLIASGTGSTQGMDISDVQPMLSSLQLSVRGSSQLANIEIELPSQRIVQSTNRGDEHHSLNRDNIEAWVATAVENIDDNHVQQLVDHLSDLISLAATTRGMTSRITDADLQRYPSLQIPIARVLKDTTSINHGLISVSEFLDPTLVQTADRAPRPKFVLRPVNAQLPPFAIVVAIAIWLIGVLRVLRILTQLVWWPPAPPDSVEAGRRASRRQWNWCWAALLSWILIAVLAHPPLFSTSGLLSIRKPIHGPHLPFSMDASTFGAAFNVSLALCAVAMLCTMIARPLLRSTGWRAGVVAATIAMLFPPLCLLTFPTGLAAWIHLTDQSTQRLFSGAAQESKQ